MSMCPSSLASVHRSALKRAPITPMGFSPLSENTVGAEVGLDPWAPGRGNYSSYEEFKEVAGAVIEAKLELGRLEWAPTLDVLTKKYGDIARSRIAVVAKEKQGKLKVRLVHDLRRSGVNDRVVVHERIVLPKATDVVVDALDL